MLCNSLCGPLKKSLETPELQKHNMHKAKERQHITSSDRDDMDFQDDDGVKIDIWNSNDRIGERSLATIDELCYTTVQTSLRKS